MSDQILDKAQQRLREVLRMKQALMSNANLRNLVYEQLDTQAKLIDGLKKPEMSAMVDQAQQLQNQILPAVLKKHGESSTEYSYWKGVLDTIVFAMYLVEGYEIQSKRLIRTQHALAYFQNLNADLEKELSQYTTMERYMTMDMLKKVIEKDEQ